MIMRFATVLTAFTLVVAAAEARQPAPRLAPPVPNHVESLSDADFSLLRRAMRAANDDDWGFVREAIYQIEDEAARNLVLWRMAVSDPRASFSDLHMALDALEGWPRQAAIQREAEWKIEDSGFSPAMIAAWFETREPLTGEGRVALGRALIALERTEEGREHIRTAWRGQSMRLSFQTDTLREFGAILTRDDHAERVDYLLWAGQRTAASRLIPELTQGEQRLAQARISLAARQAGVDAAVNAVPSPLQAHPGLLYERARFRRQRRVGDALPLLLELPDQHQNPGALSSMWTERKLMILDRVRERDWETAYALAAGHGMSSGVDFADAEFNAGWIALTGLNRPELALEHFLSLEEGVRTPVSLSRAKYWQGRAAEAAGELELARERFLAAAEHPTAYYGQLAILALGPDAAEITLPPDPDPAPAVRAAFEARTEIRAVRLLAEIGSEYFFRVFIFHFANAAETPEEVAMVADIALDHMRLREAVRAAKSSRTSGTALAERAYPMIDLPQNAPIFPDAALTLSVIRQETEFDARAISGAGARGIMQMMPATARQTAAQLRLPYNLDWLTDDPQYNMVLGMAHLDQVVNAYDGSLVMALAAYNAGGHRVRTWVANYGDPRTGDIDPIDWVESIPFSETRNYVQRVIENVQVYRARMSQTGSAPLTLQSDMVGGQFRRDLPALPPDFIAALREAETMAGEDMDADDENGEPGEGLPADEPSGR
ncbi:MAG: lytic transglycosylase domain-containing protein [Oceanicaulis sp.]|nr:lytic transglycosylase domain-containing protein [Oceanicaulis sp.]